MAYHDQKGGKALAYHDKRFPQKTLFCHTRQQEVRMMKLAEHLQVANKSDVCRVLIDEAYERLMLDKV